MSEIKTEIKNIESIDIKWVAKARKRLKEQTRPAGSLGLLETFLERLVAIQKTEKIDIASKRILIFAADHGVTEEGVSLYPKEVTQAMVFNFMNGGATVNALARSIDADVKVVDVGVDFDFSADDRLISKKAARGTKNFTNGPAMWPGELEIALNAGWDCVKQAVSDGIRILGIGEMGIGNTTSASAVVAALLDLPAQAVTGRGTGLNDDGVQHKCDVIERALKLHAGHLREPFEVLRRVGGFEIAAMTGALLACARFSVPAVVDGWIVSASALAAVRLNPRVFDYLFFAHQSEESGHRTLIDALEAVPILNLSMRLGEASGAALAMGILDAAARVYNETATFQEAGVAGRDK